MVEFLEHCEGVDITTISNLYMRKLKHKLVDSNLRSQRKPVVALALNSFTPVPGTLLLGLHYKTVSLYMPKLYIGNTRFKRYCVVFLEVVGIRGLARQNT